MRPFTNHAIALLIGLLLIIIALLDFSTPSAQVVVSTFLLISGVVGAGIAFRAHYARNKFLAAVEIVLFMISILIAANVLFDVWINWGDFQARAR